MALAVDSKAFYVRPGMRSTPVLHKVDHLSRVLGVMWTNGGQVQPRVHLCPLCPSIYVHAKAARPGAQELRVPPPRRRRGRPSCYLRAPLAPSPLPPLSPAGIALAAAKTAKREWCQVRRAAAGLTDAAAAVQHVCGPPSAKVAWNPMGSSWAQARGAPERKEVGSPTHWRTHETRASQAPSRFGIGVAHPGAPPLRHAGHVGAPGAGCTCVTHGA